MLVKRTDKVLYPDQSRVLIRPFKAASEQQTRNIIGRVMDLSPQTVDSRLQRILDEFRGRHHRLREFFLDRFHHLEQYVPSAPMLSDHRKLLLGAYFTQEYALESAALFNPSMVWHPNQEGLQPGSRRFILSLRAAGEGHISSIVFRSGTIDADGQHRASAERVQLRKQHAVCAW